MAGFHCRVPAGTPREGGCVIEDVASSLRSSHFYSLSPQQRVWCWAPSGEATCRILFPEGLLRTSFQHLIYFCCGPVALGSPVWGLLSGGTTIRSFSEGSSCTGTSHFLPASDPNPWRPPSWSVALPSVERQEPSFLCLEFSLFCCQAGVTFIPLAI